MTVCFVVKLGKIRLYNFVIFSVYNVVTNAKIIIIIKSETIVLVFQCAQV